MMHARMARGGGNKRLAGSRGLPVASQPHQGGARHGSAAPRRAATYSCAACRLPPPRMWACGRPGSARARGALGGQWELALPWEEWDLGAGRELALAAAAAPGGTTCRCSVAWTREHPRGGSRGKPSHLLLPTPTCSAAFDFRSIREKKTRTSTNHDVLNLFSTIRRLADSLPKCGHTLLAIDETGVRQTVPLWTCRH